MQLNAGASEEEINELLGSAGTELPQEYLDFLRAANGGEGPLGERGYLALWRAEEVGQANQEYSVAEFAPGLLLIGSDGGGTAVGIDLRSSDSGGMHFVELPFIPMRVEEIF